MLAILYPFEKWKVPLKITHSHIFHIKDRMNGNMIHKNFFHFGDLSQVTRNRLLSSCTRWAIDTGAHSHGRLWYIWELCYAIEESRTRGRRGRRDCGEAAQVGGTDRHEPWNANVICLCVVRIPPSFCCFAVGLSNFSMQRHFIRELSHPSCAPPSPSRSFSIRHRH